MLALRTPADDLKTVFGGLVFVWVCFIAQVVCFVFKSIDLAAWLGVMPRTPLGLVGIITAPLLHAGWDHLIANSIALGILCYLARRTAPEGMSSAIFYAMICGGALAWLTGEPGRPHIGASGVAFGLIGFLLVNGLVRGGCGPILVTLVVGFLFGGAVLTVLKTTSNEGISLSWQMHAGGMVGGVIAAWTSRERKRD